MNLVGRWGHNSAHNCVLLHLGLIPFSLGGSLAKMCGKETMISVHLKISSFPSTLSNVPKYNVLD